MLLSVEFMFSIMVDVVIIQYGSNLFCDLKKYDSKIKNLQMQLSSN
jgi:hypothetical protein